MSGDCVHQVSALLVMNPPVVMKDAAVQVQFIPALPPLFQPLYVPPVLCANVVMPPGPTTHIHSPVAPVCSAAVRSSYLPIVLVVRCILPFLDAFEVLYTTRSLYAYWSHTPHILAWHKAYIRKQLSGFVPDTVRRTVRTSAGRMGYADLGTAMRPS